MCVGAWESACSRWCWYSWFTDNTLKSRSQSDTFKTEMKLCFFYALAISLSVKAILLAVANDPKWSKLPLTSVTVVVCHSHPCSFHFSHTGLLSATKILQTRCYLWLFYLFLSLPGSLFPCKLQSPLSPGSTLTSSVNPTLTTLFRIVSTFSFPELPIFPAQVYFSP